MPLTSTPLNAGAPALSVGGPRLGLAALVFAAAAFAFPALAQAPPIEIQASIPAAPATVQIFRLSSAMPPADFLNEKLKALSLPALRTEQSRLIARGSHVPEHTTLVRAFVDPKSGDAHLIPDLAELVAPATGRHLRVLKRENLEALGRTALLDERFIPRDLTEARPAGSIPVMAGPLSKLKRPGGRAAAARVEPKTVMTLVPAIRYAAGRPVFGRGSHAVVTLASDGRLVGAVRRWKTATSAETVETRISADEVRASIERQLKAIATDGSHAIVDQVQLAYYDAAGDYLQPVYEFEATVTPATKQVSPTRVRGYVPIGPTREAIPDLAAPPTGPSPAPPRRAIAENQTRTLDAVGDARIRAEIGGAGTPDDITLGEYANQSWQSDSGYVDMSNTFLSGLLSDNIAPINRTQWYVAYPWEVVGPNSRYFLNAVNVAYTVPHGDWLINSTRSNCCDLWYVPNIGTGGNPGFGAATGGVLATWIIMSCEVVPSYYDRANEIGGTGNGYTAFDAWWPVFQGLHNVIGFRTIMFYPDDSLQWTFGHDAALGGDVNAAWFQALAAVEGGVGTYASQHLNGNRPVHYDRGSTFIDGRDLGQSIYNVQAQTASGTLWNFWMGD